jgi:hypothetical protein
MLENLVGDKKNFAIEYSIQSVNRETAFGDCLIWLRGNYLGGLEGECYLNMICQWLKRCINIKEKLFMKNELYELSDVEIFNFLEEQERNEEKDNYYFLDTDGFDLFRNYIYRKNENFHFLWQLDKDYWQEFKPKGISTSLFTAQVDIFTYINIVYTFEEALSQVYDTSCRSSRTE